MPAGQMAAAGFRVTPEAGRETRRARLAVDVVVGGRRIGQAAEALVDVTRGLAAWQTIGKPGIEIPGR